MSIIDSNNAGIKSVIEDWFRSNVENNIRPKVVKIGGKYSHIDVEGDVIIKNYKGPTLPNYVKFDKVSGDFICSNSKLSSMNGFPTKVGKDFSCSNCPHITSLSGIPQYIGGNCDVRNCGKKFSEIDVMRVSDVTGSVYC